MVFTKTISKISGLSATPEAIIVSAFVFFILAILHFVFYAAYDIYIHRINSSGLI
jgi:hypothetical protein